MNNQNQTQKINFMINSLKLSIKNAKEEQHKQANKQKKEYINALNLFNTVSSFIDNEEELEGYFMDCFTPSNPKNDKVALKQIRAKAYKLFSVFNSLKYDNKFNGVFNDNKINNIINVLNCLSIIECL